MVTLPSVTFLELVLRAYPKRTLRSTNEGWPVHCCSDPSLPYRVSHRRYCDASLLCALLCVRFDRCDTRVRIPGVKGKSCASHPPRWINRSPPPVVGQAIEALSVTKP